MPLEVVCANCGATMYTGFDLKSPKEVLRATQNKCKSCGKPLSAHDFSVEVVRPHGA